MGSDIAVSVVGTTCTFYLLKRNLVVVVVRVQASHGELFVKEEGFSVW